MNLTAMIYHMGIEIITAILSLNLNKGRTSTSEPVTPLDSLKLRIAAILNK